MWIISGGTACCLKMLSSLSSALLHHTQNSSATANGWSAAKHLMAGIYKPFMSSKKIVIMSYMRVV